MMSPAFLRPMDMLWLRASEARYFMKEMESEGLRPSPLSFC